MNIQELVAELQRQKETRIDVVVDSRQLQATAVEAPDTIVLQVPMPEEEEGAPLQLTTYAHAQLAQKTGIPKRYYDRIKEAGMGELLANNVNAWIGDRDTRLIRILDGKIRAILSDRYKLLDNYDLVFAALEEFENAGAKIHKCQISETNMYIKAVTPHIVEEVRAGDKAIPGVVIRNSEVGAGRLSVEPYAVRLVCDNGMIGEMTVKKIHLGAKMELGEILSDETKELESQTLWSTVKDVIAATFDPARFSAWVAQMQRAANENISNPVTAVDHIAKDYKIDDTRKNMLLEKFSTGKDYTIWGLANAVTSMAKDEAQPEKMAELEHVGADILKLSGVDLAEQVA